MSDLDDRLRAALRSIEVEGPSVGIAHQRVLRAAAARRQRRRGRWAAGALALLALPGGMTAMNLASGGGEAGTRLEVDGPGVERPDDGAVPTIDERARGEVPPTTTPELAASSRRSADAAAGPGAANASGPAAPTGSPALEVSPPTTAPRSRTEPAAPGDEGCVVEGYDDRSVYVPNGGVGAGAPPSCSYVATRDGGYVGTGSWILEIERDGYRRTLRAGDAADCGPLGVIRAGDTVTATVRGGLESASSAGSLKVGTAWRC